MIWIIDGDTVIGYASLDAAQRCEKPIVEVSAMAATSGYEVDVRVSDVTIFQDNSENY
jgi:hypothetical protein